MDDPLAPKVAQSVQLSFGAFVDPSAGEKHDVVMLTIVGAGEGDTVSRYVLSTDQASALARAVLEGPPPPS